MNTKHPEHALLDTLRAEGLRLADVRNAFRARLDQARAEVAQAEAALPAALWALAEALAAEAPAGERAAAERRIEALEGQSRRAEALLDAAALFNIEFEQRQEALWDHERKARQRLADRAELAALLPELDRFHVRDLRRMRGFHALCKAIGLDDPQVAEALAQVAALEAGAA
jgi:hypothetical protein